MRNAWNDLFVSIRQMIHKMNRSAVPSRAGMCSINITQNEIWLATSENGTGQHINLLASSPLREEKDFEWVLEHLVEQYKLQGMPCVWILSPSQYLLFLMDSLPVPPSEFQAAIRWKLTEMIPWPVENAIIDSFPVPAQKTHDPREMIMVAVARSDHLQYGANVILRAGLNLQSIGIQELALRNIVRLFEKEERSTAFVYLEETTSEVIISKNRLLYLHRHLGTSLNEVGDISDKADLLAKGNPALEKLSLELQRSFDYFQSQWRHAPPAQMYLDSTLKNIGSELIASYLASRLSIPVMKLPLEQVVTIKQALLPDLQGYYLPAIGGLLEKESRARATGN